jgi:hypothetical protein
LADPVLEDRDLEDQDSEDQDSEDRLSVAPALAVRLAHLLVHYRFLVV